MKVYITFCYFYLNLNKMSQADLFKRVGELLQAKEKSLDLSNNSIGNEGAIDLAEMLKVNKSLTRLDLSNNSIGDDGAIALAKMLKVNTSLEWLILSNNSIGDKGAKALAKTLKEVNRSLKCLILSNNSIGDNGVIALTKMYNDSTSLVWLILFDNPIGDKGKIALEIMTRMTLHKLVHSKDSIVSEKAKYLAEIFSKFKKVKRSVEKSHRRKNIKSKTKSGPKRSSNRKNY